jgi:putative sterol carrier protein
MAENAAPAGVSEGIGEVDASQLAAMVAQVPDEELAQGMSDPGGRKMVLDQIFRRMAEHADPGQIEDVEAIVHFRITGSPEGGDDVYEAAISGGAVTVNEAPTTEEPKVTITIAPVPFLKLVTGQASGPVLFMSGKLKLSGDLLFANRMTSFFRIPSASA